MSEQLVTLDTILDRYPAKPEYLIFLLQEVQAEYNYISPEAMQLVADYIGVPLSRAYAVATFYQSFSLEPKGEHELKVCMGTACHLKGGDRIVEDLERKLGVEAGGTTDDLMYSLDTVNCLGACALSPVLVVDEGYHPQATSQKINKLLKQLAQD